MFNQYQEQSRQMGVSGEILIDADPKKGFFRVKLRNIQPENALSEFTKGIIFAVSCCGQSLNLTVKQHTSEEGESHG